VLWLSGGIALGLAGQAVTGEDAWFLAVPLAVAAGWWRLADPGKCTGPPADGEGPPPAG
jgi:hypothetical protein